MFGETTRFWTVEVAVPGVAAPSVATTVKLEVVPEVVGVPEIVPTVLFAFVVKLSPAGRVPVSTNVEMVALPDPGVTVNVAV
jgi:hypothetical protein